MAAILLRIGLSRSRQIFYPHQPGTNQNCRNCNNPDQAFLHRQPPWLSYRLILPRLYSPLVSAAAIVSIVPFGSVASAAWIHSFRSASALPLSSPSAYTGLVYLPIRNIVLFQLLHFFEGQRPGTGAAKGAKTAADDLSSAAVWWSIGGSNP